MAESFIFLPRKTFGIVAHAVAILAILSGCAFLGWKAFQQTNGSMLVLYLLGAVGLFILLPLAGYRGYALLKGYYSLKRDGLRIRWGLRAEDVPLSEVIWVRPATDLEVPLKRPPFAFPGSLLGLVDHPDLGEVEFIASGMENLVIVSTINKVFAVSPELMDEFVQRFQRALEMGTLTPMEPYSAVPAAFLRQIAQDKYGRSLIPGAFGLTLSFVVIVGLSISARPTVSIGYDPTGNPLAPVSSMRMLLLPVLGVILFILGTIAGIMLYRNPESRAVSRLVWVSSLVTPVLLIMASALLMSAS